MLNEKFAVYFILAILYKIVVLYFIFKRKETLPALRSFISRIEAAAAEPLAREEKS